MNTRFQRSFAIRILALLTCSLSCSIMRADVTARYKTEITMNPAVAALAAGAMQGVQAAVPLETGFRLKNGKGVSSANGFTTTVDYSTKEVTIMDAATMRYAKMAYQQFVDETFKAIPETPANAKGALASLKTSVSDARLTGRSAVIQGVEAEEREMVVSIEAPAIPNMPAPAGPQPASPMMRMVVQFWTSKPAAALSNPAIHELAGYAAYQDATMNPLGAIDRLTKVMPGFADALQPMLTQIRAGGTLLRMHMDFFMPAMAPILQQMAAGRDPGAPALDPEAPLIQMNQDLVELSTDPVPDSAFQVPEGYQEVPPSEMIQASLAKAKLPVHK